MYEIVIVGGGVMGASVAYHAASAGASVALIEAGLPGRATTAGAGIISDYGLGDDDFSPSWLSLVKRSTAEYRALFGELGDQAARASEFREVGEVVVARDDAELASLRRFEERLATDAQPASRSQFTRLDATGLQNLWPYAAGDLVGTFVPGTARVDGNKLAEVLLAAAVGAGAEVVKGSAEPSPGLPTSVSVDGRVVAGAALVIASGIWAPSFAAAIGVPLRIRADRGQIVHFQGEADVASAPVLKTFAGPYILGFGGGRVVAGATHADAEGAEIFPLAGDQLEVLSEAFRVAPGLRSTRILETRVGFRPASPDGFPLIGEALDGVYVASGLGSWGLTMGPLLGRLLTRTILGAPVDFDLGFLSPLRGLTA